MRFLFVLFLASAFSAPTQFKTVKKPINLGMQVNHAKKNNQAWDHNEE
jgi:hypothetical protein